MRVRPTRTTAAVFLALVLAGTTTAGSVAAGSAKARCTESVPYQAGVDGYASYRIPAVVRTADGAVLAFAEGRRGGSSDTGDIDIVLRRSTDGGCTWAALQLVTDQGPNTIGNPAPVVDPSTGDVVLLSVRNGPVSEAQILRGEVSAENSRRVSCSGVLTTARRSTRRARSPRPPSCPTGGGTRPRQDMASRCARVGW
jgi:sialidase-1